ncbi:DUF229 and/or Sulfatase domain containing protein, partial [Asbolus verrucosus]
YNFTSQKYLIDTPSCKIPDIDPFIDEIERFYRHEEYTPCSKEHLLSYIEKNNGYTTLNINRSVVHLYTSTRIYCCYSKITRYVTAEKPDDIIDISKLNLVRTMPKTYGFLEKNNFINLKGYMKVGLNTLPNLMAMLAGQTMKQVEKFCDYTNKIDDCPNIWKQFKKLGYITAYGEDSSYISSFNYNKKGFLYPPTDFYFRPYILAAEKLQIIERKNMYYCTGPETEGERIMNLAKDFQITLKQYPKFGLFWMNSFSHEDLNMASAMDEKIEDFLENIYKHLDKTILFFFSDHGFRFGEIRNTYTGWVEERLPFFYVYLPEIFKTNYPAKYNNFFINSQRLTNAFDIYMTLQDILVLADENFPLERSLACPKCHSLFAEVSNKRTCSDAAIETEWCVCNLPTYINTEEVIVQNAAHFFVNKINTLMKSYPQSHKCYEYRLKTVTYSGISQFTDKKNQTRTGLLLRIKTTPKAIFESLIELSHGSDSQLRLEGDISRLNRYAPYTKCIESSSLEKYCYCKEDIFAKIKKNFFCKIDRSLNCIYHNMDHR